jgi:hypothetical protein
MCVWGVCASLPIHNDKHMIQSTGDEADREAAGPLLHRQGLQGDRLQVAGVSHLVQHLIHPAALQVSRLPYFMFQTHPKNPLKET